MPDCIFCDIVAGQAPAHKVYADEHCTAFMDIRPVNPGHVLVVPNRHAANLAGLAPEDGAAVFQVGQKLAAALYASGLPCEGLNLWLADGPAAGQEVFHVHLHILPRFRGDGFGLKFGPHYPTQPERAELYAAATQIRQALQG